MLKRMFALSNQGLRDLNKGIAATTLSNLCLIAPVSLLVMVIWELLNVISGQESSMRDHAALFICGTVVMFIIVFLTQWLQYNKTYTVAYKESANRRIVLAEKLRKLPLSFFGQRDLSDLTTTIMGDCTALERVFSNAIPQLFGTIFMFIITAIGLLVLDWRMGLCIVVPVPVAALVVFAAKKAQSNAESANMDAKRAAYDGVQEYLDTIQELKPCSREEEYLEGLEKKLDYVVKCSFRNEIAPGAATTTAQFILRFGLVAVMLVGGILVTTGSLSIPMFILFLLFAGRIYDPFTSCFMLMAEVFSALVSVKRMKQIDATPEQTGTNVCNNKGYDIEFKNVVFSYNEEPVLKGVSFVAKQGEVTALEEVSCAESAAAVSPVSCARSVSVVFFSDVLPQPATQEATIATPSIHANTRFFMFLTLPCLVICSVFHCCLPLFDLFIKSRSESPQSWKAATVINKAIPLNTIIHGAV